MTARLLALLLLAAGAALAADRPDNFVQWRPGLASSAQPDERWLARTKEMGYDVVVDLMPPHMHGANEPRILASKGVAYVNIPVDFARPAAADFRRFAEVLRANKERNVLVHCMVNMRGSSFTFLYRVIHEGAPVNETLDKVYGVWTPDRVWKKFIEETLAANGKKAELM